MRSVLGRGNLLPAPLESPSELVDLLADCTGEPRATVISRLVDEIRCSGVNVRRDASEFGLEPYVWSEKLIEFYRGTKSFVYETAVWNHSHLKQSIRKWIGDFLPSAIPPGGRVLVYGDGLGFDSAFLASLGLNVTSLEPSEGGRRFGAQVFERNGVSVRQLSGDNELTDSSFDAIVCLDVLEHVPSPPDTLAEFRRRLMSDGVLVVAAPFFCIEPYRPTHLRANRKYSTGEGRLRNDGLEQCGDELAQQAPSTGSGQAASAQRGESSSSSMSGSSRRIIRRWAST